MACDWKGPKDRKPWFDVVSPPVGPQFATVSIPCPGAGTGTLWLGTDESKINAQYYVEADGNTARAYLSGSFTLGGAIWNTTYGPSVASLEITFKCKPEKAKCQVSKVNQEWTPNNNNNQMAGVGATITADVYVDGNVYIVTFNFIVAQGAVVQQTASAAVTLQGELAKTPGTNTLVNLVVGASTTTTKSPASWQTSLAVSQRCGDVDEELESTLPRRLTPPIEWQRDVMRRFFEPLVPGEQPLPKDAKVPW